MYRSTNDVEYIDKDTDMLTVTLRWSGLLPVFIQMIETGSQKGRQFALQELYRMARLADMYVKQNKQS